MKRILTVCTALVILLSGCGAASTATSGAENNSQSQVSAADANTMTGTLGEVKDYMFVVTQDNGDSFAFAFDGEKPNWRQGHRHLYRRGFSHRCIYR